MFRNMLLRLDDTREAELAACAALSFARGYGARVTGLYAREPARFHFAPPEAEDERQARTLDLFATHARALGVPCRTVVMTGSATAVLSRASDTADLIALPCGENGRGAIGAELQMLVKHLPHPFLIASEENPAIRRIAVAYDGRPGAVRALMAAADLVHFWNPAGVELVVAQVRVDGDPAAGLLGPARRYLESYGIPFRVRHLAGEVDRALVEFGEDDEVDLLCMGAYGHSTLREMVAGSTTHRVVRRRRKPILLFH